MNKSTPPKHKTPNWKLVTRWLPIKGWSANWEAQVVRWEAMPLRAGRKDIP